MSLLQSFLCCFLDVKNIKLQYRYHSISNMEAVQRLVRSLKSGRSDSLPEGKHWVKLVQMLRKNYVYKERIKHQTPIH